MSETSSGAGDVAAEPLVREIAIVNRRGLHARAAAKLVTLVERFSANVDVLRDGQVVSARSILGLMLLGGGIGSTILVAAEGPQAEAALDALARLVAERFGEDE